MKRVLPLLLLLFTALLACRKAPTPVAAATTSASATTSTAPAPSEQQPAPPPIKPMPAKLPDVLAKLNGEPIERWELENGLKRIEGRAGSKVPLEKRDEVLRNILDQLVSYHLLVQESRARKLNVTDAELEGQLTAIRQSFPTQQAFQQGIAEQGLTPDRLRRQTRMSLEIQKVLESEINSKVSVSDADVDTFYKQNLDRFKEGESVRASHILIAVPPKADAAQKQAARAKAQQLLKEVRAGSDFAKLAREQSQDPGTAPNGGELGFFPKGQMTPEFEKAAFATKDGAISDLVDTPFGFHIIKVHEHRAARTVPLAEAAPRVKEFLTQTDRQTRLEKFIDQIKMKTKIELLV
jgi:peptidyl-prolyl cis-trans isomerase C